MSKSEFVYFVLTEEGMESMASTPYEAFTNYIAAGSSGGNLDYEWLNKVITGESEIECIVEMTRDEYREWLKTAKEV